MELLSVFAVLRRRRLFVLPGALLALLVAVMTLYHVSLKSPHLVSRRVASGVAIGQTMLTAGRASAVDLATNNAVADTLPNRANLLANYLATDAARTEIARRAHVPANQLTVLGPSAGLPPYSVPIANEATAAAQRVGGAYGIFIDAMQSPPELDMRAAAPAPEQAARLLEATRSTIAGILAAGRTSKAGVGSVDLGPIRAALIVHKPSKILAPIAAIFVFVLWCAGVIVIGAALPRLIRGRVAPKPVPAA
jgi:hypothetical protein